MGARWYNPSTATFRTRDTYAGKLETPFSLNRYTYALNNPTRYWDPTGRESYDLGALDFGSFDLSGLAASYGVSGPAEPVSYAAANPSAGVYNYVVNYTDGSSQISTIAPTGIAISTDQTTQRSGNLSYTPGDETANAAIIMIQSGSNANAIMQAANDAFNKIGASATSDAIVATSLGLEVGEGCLILVREYSRQAQTIWIVHRRRSNLSFRSNTQRTQPRNTTP